MNVSEGDTFLFIFVGPFQWRHYFSKHSVFFPFRTKEYKSLKCLKKNVLHTQWKKAVRVLCIIIRNHLMKIFVCVLYAECKKSMSSGWSSLVLMKKIKKHLCLPKNWYDPSTNKYLLDTLHTTLFWNFVRNAFSYLKIYWNWNFISYFLLEKNIKFDEKLHLIW